MGHQGQGNGTLYKEQGYADIFRMSLRISKAPSVAQWPYRHLDLNSGSGWNEEAHCEGSPIVFLREAVEVFRPGPINAYFCDINGESIGHLEGACHEFIRQLDSCTVTAKATDNGTFLDEVAASIREEERRPDLAIGTCVCDPNGFKGFPLESLVRFAHDFPRIDIVLNINCNLFRSVEGCKTSTKLPPKSVEAFRRWPTVPEMIDALGRVCWMIRNPQRVSGHAFTQLIGRTLGTGKRAFGGFFSLDSPEGQKILARLRRIEPDQGLLFEDWE